MKRHLQLPITKYLRNAKQTSDLGSILANHVAPRFYISLSGELGSGKTTLARGLIQNLGVTQNIKSPSYSLIETYTIDTLTLCHFDFYRLTSALEFVDAGLGEYFESENICIVEWPSIVASAIRKPDIAIDLQYSKTGRTAIIKSNTNAGDTYLLKTGLTER